MTSGNTQIQKVDCDLCLSLCLFSNFTDRDFIKQSSEKTPIYSHNSKFTTYTPVPPKPYLFFWLKAVCQSMVIYGAANLCAG